MIGIFTKDQEVIPYGVAALRYISYGYVFYAYGMVMVAAFNGAGDTTTPTIINLACYWLFQIPLAYALALPVGMGADGVFIAIMVGRISACGRGNIGVPAWPLEAAQDIMRAQSGLRAG